jgi:hypothetical protein
MKLKATQKLAMKGLEGAASLKSKVHASYIYCTTSLLSPESMGPAYKPGETGMVQARVGVPESDPPYSGPTCPIYILLSYKFIHTHTQASHDESIEI